MSFSSLRTTVETLFDSQWPFTPIEYENVPINLSSVSEYVSIVVLVGESSQASLGPDGNARVSGSVVISIFTSRGAGTSRSLELADNASNIFQGLKIGSLQFYTSRGTSIHNRTDYFQFNVSIPFIAYFHI